MTEKDWILSQNFLTVDILTLFFHIKNIPFFGFFALLHLITSDFFMSFIPSLGYFFLMTSVFPPTIVDKDKTIYVYVIKWIDKILVKIIRLIERKYFYFMNIW